MINGLFKINGHSYKCPSNLKPVVTTLVNSGRNSNGIMVGQRVGRDQFKLDSLKWNMLTVSEWSEILKEFKNFHTVISLFDPVEAEWRTLTIYPSDRSCEYPKGRRYYNADGTPKIWLNCTVNLIDTGK